MTSRTGTVLPYTLFIVALGAVLTLVLLGQVQQDAVLAAAATERRDRDTLCASALAALTAAGRREVREGRLDPIRIANAANQALALLAEPAGPPPAELRPVASAPIPLFVAPVAAGSADTQVWPPPPPDCRTAAGTLRFELHLHDPAGAPVLLDLHWIEVAAPAYEFVTASDPLLVKGLRLVVEGHSLVGAGVDVTAPPPLLKGPVYTRGTLPAAAGWSVHDIPHPRPLWGLPALSALLDEPSTASVAASAQSLALAPGRVPRGRRLSWDAPDALPDGAPEGLRIGEGPDGPCLELDLALAVADSALTIIPGPDCEGRTLRVLGAPTGTSLPPLLVTARLPLLLAGNNSRPVALATDAQPLVFDALGNTTGIQVWDCWLVLAARAASIAFQGWTPGRHAEVRLQGGLLTEGSLTAVPSQLDTCLTIAPNPALRRALADAPFRLDRHVRVHARRAPTATSETTVAAATIPPEGGRTRVGVRNPRFP